MARTPKSKDLVTVADDEAAATATASSEIKLSVAKVKVQASALRSEAVDSARRAATQGKTMAAEALDDLAKLASSAATTVDERIGPQYGDYARMAATTVSNAATSLQAKGVDDIVADTVAFVRKRPAVALGAVAAVGVVVAALLRGSAGTSSDEPEG